MLEQLQELSRLPVKCSDIAEAKTMITAAVIERDQHEAELSLSLLLGGLRVVL